MNRSNGAYAPTKYYDFCIVLKLQGGGHFQTVISAHSAKFALGRAFSEIRNAATMENDDSLLPAEKDAVAFCKTPDQMSRDDRFRWDVATDADYRAIQREQDANRLPMSMLDCY